MIRHAAMKEGLVFTDDKDGLTTPVYWQVVEVHPDGVVAQNIETKTHRTYAEGSSHEYEGLVPVSDDPHISLDLRPLIGKRCRIKTRFGQITAEIVRTVRRSIAVESDERGQHIWYDVALISRDGDKYHVNEIEHINVVGR